MCGESSCGGEEGEGNRMMINLSRNEVDVLTAILCKIGGDPNKQRGHADSVLKKLRKFPVNPDFVPKWASWAAATSGGSIYFEL